MWKHKNIILPGMYAISLSLSPMYKKKNAPMHFTHVNIFHSILKKNKTTQYVASVLSTPSNHHEHLGLLSFGQYQP